MLLVARLVVEEVHLVEAQVQLAELQSALVQVLLQVALLELDPVVVTGTKFVQAAS